MDHTIHDHLKTLHTAAIDARNGYQEALDDAEGQDKERRMTPLFRDMVALHQRHADQLGQELTKAGVTPDQDGSFMSTVHKTIMDVRSLFGGLDDSVVPGLIDGEKRNVAAYDDAINGAAQPTSIESLIGDQRAELVKKIAEMEAIKGT